MHSDIHYRAARRLVRTQAFTIVPQYVLFTLRHSPLCCQTSCLHSGIHHCAATRLVRTQAFTIVTQHVLFALRYSLSCCKTSCPHAGIHYCAAIRLVRTQAFSIVTQYVLIITLRQLAHLAAESAGSDPPVECQLAEGQTQPLSQPAASLPPPTMCVRVRVCVRACV